jgi:putative ABC transport system permease protein
MGATTRLALAGVRRRGVVQSLVLVLVTALDSAAVVAGLAGTTTAGDLVDEAYGRSGRPDVVLYGSAEALRTAADDDAVAAASSPVLVADAETLVDDDPVDVDVAELAPPTDDGVGSPRLAGGRWPEADDEVVVERSLVVDGVVDLGGTLTVTAGSTTRELRVVGDVVELSDCFWPNCDPLRVFGQEALVRALDGGDDVHVASYRLRDPSTATAVSARLNDLDGVLGSNAWPDTRGDILVVGEVFGAMVAGFGAFLLASACFVVAGATAARLVARRRSLGLLRAVGFRPAQLTAATLVEHLVLGAVGVVVGWFAGSFAAPALGGVDDILDASTTTHRVGPLLVALVLVEALLTVAVVLPAWRAGRQPATEVLRDVPPSPNGGRLLGAVARRLGAGPSTIAGLRRTTARPLRAALAGGALFVAAVGAVVAAGFIGTVDAAIDDPARTGNPYDAYAVSSGAPDGEIAAVLDATPEVTAWHREVETGVTVDDARYLARVLDGDPADYRVQEGRGLERPGDAIVGYGFLQETGLDVGDRIAGTIADGAPVDLEIVGWYLETADAGKTVVLDAASLPSGVELDDVTYRIVAADGVDRDAVAAAVGSALGDGAAVVASDPGDDGVGAIVGTLVVFAQLLAGVAFSNLLATNVAATWERARAIGMLRTIGCTTRQLVTQSAVGSGVLGLLAGLVGVPLGVVVFDALGDLVGSGVGIGPGLTESPGPAFLVAVVVASTVTAAAVGALAALRLSRLPAAALVRYE